MVKWTEIEVDFGEDETVNFGKRHEFVSLSSLYHVQTIATISGAHSPGESNGLLEIAPVIDKAELVPVIAQTCWTLEVTDTLEMPENDSTSCFPHVVAASNGNNVAVCLDSEVSFFRTEPFQFLGQVSLDQNVSALCWLVDSSFVMAAMTGGQIAVLYTQNDVKVLLNKKLIKTADDCSVSGTVVGMKSSMVSGDCQVVVVMERGSMCVLHIPNFSSVIQAVDKGDLSTLKRLFRPQTSILACENVNWMDVAFLETPFCHGLMLLPEAASWKWKCTTWGNDDQLLEPSDMLQLASDNGSCGEFVRIETCAAGRYAFLLSTSGYLWHLDVWFGALLNRFPNTEEDDADLEPVRDFQLVENQADSVDLSDKRLILLRKAIQETVVEIRGLPRFDLLYSVKVALHTVLVRCPSYLDAAFGLVECAQTPDGSGVESVRLRAITESQPETRLSRLLNKRQFAEARHFAARFRLDLQLVYTTEINYLTSELAGGGDASAFEALEECLQRVDDSLMLAEACLNAASVLPKYTWIGTLIWRGQQALKQCDQNSEKFRQLNAKLGVLEQRLHTYRLINGPEGDVGPHSNWKSFVSGGAWTEILGELIDQGLANEANLLWVRHETELRQSLLENGAWPSIFKKLVESVTDLRRCTSGDIKIFLESYLVPSAFYDAPKLAADIVPIGLLKLCKWLEAGELKQWPDNALDFAQSIKRVFQRWWTVDQAGDEVNLLALITPEQQAKGAYAYCIIKPDGENLESPIGQLNQLANHLQELAILHHSFNCQLSYGQFVKETTQSICYRILDRVQVVELLPQSVEQFARPYMKRHRLPKDETLFKYVLDVAEQSATASSAVFGGSTWEDRALTVIGCVESLEYYCKSVLVVATRARIPWSRSVTALVRATLHYKHPCVQELRSQCRLADLRHLLRKYDVSGQMLASCLFNRCQFSKMLSHMVLSGGTGDQQSQPEVALKDAIEAARLSQLVPEAEVYVMFGMRMIKLGRIESVLDVLSGLADSLKLECAKRLFYRIQLHADSTYCMDTANQETLNILEAGLSIYNRVLESLLSNSEESKQFAKTAAAFKCMRTLQERFGISVCMSQVVESPEKLLESYLQREEKLSTIETLKFGAILHIDSFQVYALLVKKFVTSQQYIDALHCLRLMIAEDLYSDSVDHAESLQELSLFMLSVILKKHNAGENGFCHIFVQLICAVSKILSFVLKNCDPSILPYLIKVLCWCKLVLVILRRSDLACDNGTHTLAPPMECMGLEKRRSVYQLSTDGLLLTGTEVIPVLQQLTLLVLESYNQEQEIRNSCNDLLRLLASQEQWMLVVLVQMYFLNSYRWESTDWELLHNHLMTLLDRIVQRCSAQTQDYWLALGIMASFQENVVFEFLRINIPKLRIDQHRQVNLLVWTGHALATFSRKKDMVTSTKDFCFIAKWSSKFAKFQLCFPFHGGDRDRAEFVNKMAEKLVPFQTLREYCSDFCLNVSEAIVKYLRTLFMKVAGDQESAVVLAVAEKFVHQSDAEGLFSVSSETCFGALQKLLLDVNPYAYDLIEFLINVLLKTENAAMKPSLQKLADLLIFLSAYKRSEKTLTDLEVRWYVSRVSENLTQRVTESLEESQFDLLSAEDSSRKQNEKKLLPQLATERLPFHVFLPASAAFDQKESIAMSILESEISLQNLSLWQRFAAATSPIRLSQNHMLNIAIRNALVKAPPLNKETQGSTSSVEITEKNIQLDLETMKNIHELLLRAKDPQVALKCAGSVVKHLAFGLPKVKAVQSGIDVATKWISTLQANKNQSSGRELEMAEQFLATFTQAYHQLGSELILDTHGLLNTSTRPLLASPAKLIFLLYESLTTEGATNQASPETVMAVAEKVAHLNNVNLVKIEDSLLECWLLPRATEHISNMDTSVVGFGLNDAAIVPVDLNAPFMDLNLIRVSYILGKKELRQASYSLVSILNEPTSSDVGSNLRKIRALCCLFRFLSVAQISQLLPNCSAEDLEAKLRDLLYVSWLERLRMSYTVQSFGAASKEALAKALLTSRTSNTVLKVIGSLVVDFRLKSPMLLKDVLSKIAASSDKELQAAFLRYCGDFQLQTLPATWIDSCGRWLKSLPTKHRRHFFEVYFFMLKNPTQTDESIQHAVRICDALNSSVMKAYFLLVQFFPEQIGPVDLKSEKFLQELDRAETPVFSWLKLK